ncbi:hypothetical protein ER57_08110 [Smithella sp. SCADC]|jgi:hypothetical protein|nr:hypothetical protein ER57_08110 [Smithella sp. SCADC]
MILDKRELIAFFEENVPENGYAEIEGSITPKNACSVCGSTTKQPMTLPLYAEEIEVRVTFRKRIG